MMRSVVKLRGVTVEMEYRLDEAEHARRQAVGLGAVTRLDMLDRFMVLPADLPVPAECLRKADRKLLLRAPGGCLEWTLDGVVRRIVPALTVVSVVAKAREWRKALERAGSFAPYCTRSVLVSQEPPTEALLEASFWGIGVLLGQGGERRTLVEPEPFVSQRHTPAKWWLAEEAYAQISQATKIKV